MFKANEVVCDRYKVLDRPFAGGMAAVFPAEDLATHQQVALKILMQHNDDRVVQRFEREIEALTQLEHPHIVRILGKVVYPWAQNQAVSIAVLEWIDGGMSLETLLYEYQCNLPMFLAVSLMYQVADAVAYAHGKELVHRDLKPSNVLLDLNFEGDMVAKVSDFGTVLMKSDTKLTATGETLGTPYYMSPEQGLAQAFPPTVDVFSFWAIMYELLTNRRPYVHRLQPLPESYADYCVKVWPPIQRGELKLEPAATFNSSVTPNLDAMMARGLAPKPEDRPSMAETSAFLKGYWEALSPEGNEGDRHLVVPSSIPPRPDPFAETLATPVSQAITRIAEAKQATKTLLGMGIAQPRLHTGLTRDVLARSAGRLDPVKINYQDAPAPVPPSQKPVTRRKITRRSNPEIAKAPEPTPEPVGVIPAMEVSQIVYPTVQATQATAPSLRQEPVLPPAKRSGSALPAMIVLALIGVIGWATSSAWLPQVKAYVSPVASASAPPQVEPAPSLEAPVAASSQPATTRLIPIVPVNPTAHLPTTPARPSRASGRHSRGNVTEGNVEGLPPGTAPPIENP